MPVMNNAQCHSRSFRLSLFKACRAIIPAMVLALAAPPASADTKRFGLTSFDRVEVLGDMIVEIAPDFRIGAVADGSRAALETLSIEVNDRTLVIRQVAEGAFGPRQASDGPIMVQITAQNLQQVMLRGAGQIRVRGLRGRDVRVDIDGPGRIEADVAAGEAVQLRSIGTGQIVATGRARDLIAVTSGSGGIDASALVVRDLTVRSIGTGMSSFSASMNATIVAGGSATVTVSGNARCSVRNSGAGTVRCGAGMTTPLPVSGQ